MMPSHLESPDPLPIARKIDTRRGREELAWFLPARTLAGHEVPGLADKLDARV
jgi:hypothetical protein